MSNFWVRAIWGAVYVAVVVFSLLAGFKGQFALTAVISSLCVLEFLRMQKAGGWLSTTIALTLNFMVLAMHPHVPEFLHFHSGSVPWETLLISTAGLLLILFFCLHLFRSGIEILTQVSPMAFGLLYISVPCLLFLKTGEGVYNWQLPMMVFILTWSSDTFAYLVGRAVGKRKLYEALSPKKTLEGFMGGVLLTAAAGALLGYIWEFGLISGLVLGMLVSVAGTAGDLFESALKRKAGIKDSGNVIPGHGGALDRFDAFLFAVVVVYAWFSVNQYLFPD
ncbi:MAG: phosphatidate cytidylyltransferase [Bacteroidetes bacterium]|nr:phosphatidate cytidylyltransferase [Bacteroidota bacterium]